MTAKRLLPALALPLGAASASLAQSQTGSSFGTLYSGTAGARNGGHYSSHTRSRDSGGQQNARGSGGEIDARDPSRQSVARLASTLQH